MPALFKMMSDEKQTVDCPAVVIAETQQSTKQRKTKKYVIIAVSAILAVAIILAAILVGMYMFTEAQKDILKYSLKLSENSNQEITSDPNENVVKYQVTTPGQDSWIVNDFNKDIQLMKIVSDGKTNCYISPLNRTNALEPSQITGQETKDVKGAVSLTYRASDTPITDTSFLSKTGKELCKGVSIYWLYPSCTDNRNRNNIQPNTTGLERPKTKRQTYSNNSPYYIRDDELWLGDDGQYYWVPCFIGCCRKMCACKIQITSVLNGNQMVCTWIYDSCPPAFLDNPLSDTCYTGPDGLSCPNQVPTQTPTC